MRSQVEVIFKDTFSEYIFLKRFLENITQYMVNELIPNCNFVAVIVTIPYTLLAWILSAMINNNNGITL